MSDQRSPKIRRAGAYVVKAGESRPSPVAAKSDGHTSPPTNRDKTLAQELLKTKRA